MKSSLRLEFIASVIALWFTVVSPRQTCAAETNIVTSAKASAGTVTNSALQAWLDAQEEEIACAMSRARDEAGHITNAAAWTAATVLISNRLSRCLDQIGKICTAEDVADKLVSDPAFGGGLRKLEELWEHPQSEPVLAAFSRKGPRMRHDLETIYGWAGQSLVKVQASKEWYPIVRGKETEAERTKAILTYLKEHPELTKRGGGNHYLRLFISTELGKSDDTNAIRMVLTSGNITTGFASRHFREMLAYAQELKPEEAFDSFPVLDWLSRAHSPEVIPLFEKLLPYAKTTDQRSFLETALRIARNPRLADED